MNTQSKGVTELLILMIVIVMVSGVILLMVRTGIISVSAENEQVQILNTEFIPLGRGGELAIEKFQFCMLVDNNYNCQGESDTFYFGDKVYFRFTIKSSTYNGEIMLVENYRIKNPHGETVLEIDEKRNFDFRKNSKDKTEAVDFKDYFNLGSDLPEGEYTLELLINNPLIDKKVTLVKKFKATYGGEGAEGE
ncbi:hypothetical protein HZC30_01865 [Candidatus Woesearchaeota archaeon]|nr:hypothetical protein [Candidatus Woesearchaeota archaeon]